MSFRQARDVLVQRKLHLRVRRHRPIADPLQPSRLQVMSKFDHYFSQLKKNIYSRPEESNELGIECTPTDEKSPYKPRNLIQMEADSLRLRSEKMFEGEFIQGDKPGTSILCSVQTGKTNASFFLQA